MGKLSAVNADKQESGFRNDKNWKSRQMIPWGMLPEGYLSTLWNNRVMITVISPDAQWPPE